MSERFFLSVVKTGEQRLDGAVGIHSGNHGEQRRKEAYFRRAFDARGEQHRQHTDGKLGHCACRYDVHTSEIRQRQHISYCMAGGGNQGQVRYAHRGVLLILENPIAAIAAKNPSSKIFMSISFHISLQNHFSPNKNTPAHRPTERQAVSTTASKKRLNAHR